MRQSRYGDSPLSAAGIKRCRVRFGQGQAASEPLYEISVGAVNGQVAVALAHFW